MAHLLNLESVTVAFAARTVLDSVSLGLDDGARVGVVGRNGDGKSTLLRVLAGLAAPDSGRVTHSRGLRVGVLDQVDDLAAVGTVRSAVVGDAPDHAYASDPAVRAVLTGLLGDVEAAVPGGFEATLSSLSGGQRRRVALAAVLVEDHDVVVLDEPTNHLDVEGVAWLAEHLRTRWPPGRGALVVVTHDRWFLDAVCERTWEVLRGAVESYDGGYAAYVLARAERGRVEAFTQARRANLLRKELAWLRRGPPARTTKPRFRIDAAEALVAAEPPPRDSVELVRTASARLGKDVLDVEDVTYAVGSGTSRRVLLDGVTWRLGPGERVGVVGVNGSGKTTLLRLLAGEVQPDAGRVKRGSTVRTAVLSQTLRELDEVGHLRVLEAVESERSSVQVAGKEVSASQLVERLGFTAERAWTPVSELSGGERRRLQLARLLITEPNVLLLDEPTNDLDTDTLAALEDLLDSYAGTLVVASHDRYLLERVSDRQVAMLGDGLVRDLPGGVEQYLGLRSTAPIGTASTSTPGTSTPGTSAPGTSAPGTSAPGTPSPTRQADAAGSGPAGRTSAQTRAGRKELARLERSLTRLGERETRLHVQMAEAAADHEAVGALDAQLRALKVEKDELEEAWLRTAETQD